MNAKLQTLLVEHTATTRLRSVLHAYGRRLQDLRVRRFLKDWPLERCRRELFGFGRQAESELLRILERYPRLAAPVDAWKGTVPLHRGRPILVGKFSLAHLEPGKMWLEVIEGEHRGEGMETTVAKVEAALEQFYQAEF